MKNCKRFAFWPIWLLLLGFVGCAVNPIKQAWYGKQWKEDETYGLTFHQRLEELADWRSQVDSMDSRQQDELAQRLTHALKNDPNPLYRSECVKTLAELDTPLVTEGLRQAIQDEDKFVRIAACQGWGVLHTGEALQQLGQTVGADTDSDVRLAATRELARFKDAAAVQSLALALDDGDPALQYRAIESLEEVTGKNLGDNVPAWRQYVHGETVEAPEEISIADRLRSLF